MILRCADALRQQLGELWESGRQRGGVFVGNLGPTRAAMLYATRCYLDDIDHALTDVADASGLIAALREEARRLVPPSNEDSFPGIMPNVISARVANYFDLNGPNMTLDSGWSSTLSALEAAHRYLATGELEFALVAGINGNSLPEYRAVLGDLLPAPVSLAEGAFMFALTTEENAARHGLPVLGYFGAEDGAGADIACGVSSAAHARYLGAAGGAALADALRGPAGRVNLVCEQTADEPPARLELTVTGAATSTTVSRYVPRLRERPAAAFRSTVPFFSEHSVLVTDNPDLVADLVPDGTIVICTGDPPGNRPGWYHVPDPTPESVGAVLANLPDRLRHLRVLADFRALAPESALLPGPDRLTRLHDAAFLVLKDRYDDLSTAGSSFITLVAGARPGDTDHPSHGLFSALAKCAFHEFPDCLVFGVFVAGHDAAHTIRLAERESGALRPFPVVLYDTDGVRKVIVPEEEPIVGRTAAVLGPDSVVLATGGARGITAEIMKEVARTFRCRMYLLGSNPLAGYPPEVFDGTDDDFATTRPAFIRRELSTRRGVTVGDLNREFDRMVDARATRRNIAEMASFSGAGNVTYIPCDVTDPDAVNAAVARVLARESCIDLVVHAAGRNRGMVLKNKSFAEFRAIRDIKVQGYRNLKAALRENPARMWCNFGSLLGYVGLPGEIDYGSGNDFLDYAARYSASQPATEEYTVGWTLWDGVGIGANDLAKAYFKRAGSYTQIPVSEGVYHFMQELHAPNRQPFVLHLGTTERTMMDRVFPGLLARPEGAAAPYLHSVVSANDGEAVFESRIDIDSDDSLNHHLVRGVPTMPGAWITEIAAEAATEVVPI